MDIMLWHNHQPDHTRKVFSISEYCIFHFRLLAPVILFLWLHSLNTCSKHNCMKVYPRLADGRWQMTTLETRKLTSPSVYALTISYTYIIEFYGEKPFILLVWSPCHSFSVRLCRMLMRVSNLSLSVEAQRVKCGNAVSNETRSVAPGYAILQLRRI